MTQNNDKNVVHHHHYYNQAPQQQIQTPLLGAGTAFAAGMLIDRGLRGDTIHRKSNFFLAWLLLGLPGLGLAFEIAGFIGFIVVFFVISLIVGICESIREWEIKLQAKRQRMSKKDIIIKRIGWSFIILFCVGFVYFGCEQDRKTQTHPIAHHTHQVTH